MASYVRSLASYLMAQFDAKVADQETREQFYKKVVVFSRRRPFLASFLAFQLLFGILPVLGLLGFALGVIGLAVGFCAFWIGLGLCVMFSILTVTATVATCVWISGVVSLLSFQWSINLLSGSAAPAKPIKKERIGEGKKKPAENVVLSTKDHQNEVHNRKENTSRREESGSQPLKIEPTGISEKVYEQDTEGSDDTVGSYSASNQYPNRIKIEDLKWGQSNTPRQLSEAEKMRRDIERSLQ